MATGGIKWHLNLLSTTRFGRAWELLVQMVKRAFLSLIAASALLSRDIFQTNTTETESIWNRRPLIVVPVEMRDMGSLTPIHLVLVRAFFNRLAHLFN